MTTFVNAQAAVCTVTTESDGKKETKTFVFGMPAENVSDNDIFLHIAKLEGTIKQWSEIENKPKKLQAKIEGLRADIKQLTELVDARP